MKTALLQLAESFGGGRVAVACTRRELRILCYHGVTEHQEADFSPVLFMRRSTFARRMEWLAQSRHRVVPLAQGLAELRAGQLAPGTVVLTFDDGWAGIGVHAWPILRRLGLPFTVYVSSYYMNAGQPVFNVCMRYLLWRARSRGLSGRQFIKQVGVITPATDPDDRLLEEELITFGESRPPVERVSLIRRAAEWVGEDADDLIASRRFGFMTPSEVSELAHAGVDIQLHTHRHRFPSSDRDAALRELADNRGALAPLVDGPLEHFCYPSGVYDASQFEWLKGAGIQSATTTETGLARASSNPYALPRLLDSEALPDCVFRSELSGLLPLARRAAGVVRRSVPTHRAVPNRY
jgi:peptidoglycan/xylan/chitin deacetylase (PgdA/CDA1 family)